jgi:hypothetical protein
MVGIARRRARGGVKVIPPDLSGRILAVPRSGRCGEGSSPAKGDQALSSLSEPEPTRPSIWKQFRIIYRKPMPRGLRGAHRTHRIRLAALEALRGLVEPIGLSGLRSGN